MFIFYGWGHRTNKVLGTKNEICPVCSNRNMPLEMIRTRTWFTLFFIPVIPYSTKYFKICPNCRNGIELKKDDFLFEINKPIEMMATPAYGTEQKSITNNSSTREITIARGKKLFASMYNINIYIDDHIVASVKNGQTINFITDQQKHSLYAFYKSTFIESRSNIIFLEESGENQAFNLEIKSDISNNSMIMTLSSENNEKLNQ